ncbi:MAG: hypothetical protein ABIJ47_13015 [Candidatus Bathyarchaeota archaeon]
MALDRYQLLGLSHLSFGAVFSSYSYLVLLSVPLTALGLACIIVGSTLLMVPGSPVPKHQVRAMMEGSLVNVEALLEEFDVKGKAVYLPPNEGRVYAFIPVQENADLEAINPDRVPVRVLTEAGGVRGVTVFPPGSEAVRLSQLTEEVGAEDALNHVLVDFIEAAEYVKFVRRGGEAVIELGKPRAASEYPRVNECLGSYAVGVAGCVLAHALRSPVYYRGEEASGDNTLGYFWVSSSG